MNYIVNAHIEAVVSMALMAVFFLIGLRAVLAPVGASAFFGVAVASPAPLTFVRAMGARNMGLALVGVVLVVFGSRVELSWLGFAAALVAAIDAWVVVAEAGARKGAKHVAYVVLFIAFGLWMAN